MIRKQPDDNGNNNNNNNNNTNNDAQEDDGFWSDEVKEDEWLCDFAGQYSERDQNIGSHARQMVTAEEAQKPPSGWDDLIRYTPKLIWNQLPLHLQFLYKDMHQDKLFFNYISVRREQDPIQQRHNLVLVANIFLTRAQFVEFDHEQANELIKELISSHPFGQTPVTPNPTNQNQKLKEDEDETEDWWDVRLCRVPIDGYSSFFLEVRHNITPGTALALHIGDELQPDFFEDYKRESERITSEGTLESIMQVQFLPNVHPCAGQRGCFAQRDIKKGEYIGEYVGEVRLIPADCSNEEKSYPFLASFWTDVRFDSYQNWLEDPSAMLKMGVDAQVCGNELRYINDWRGVDPIGKENTVYYMVSWVRGCHRLLAQAKKDIPKGHEFLVNYGEGYWRCNGGKQLGFV